MCRTFPDPTDRAMTERVADSAAIMCVVDADRDQLDPAPEEASSATRWDRAHAHRHRFMERYERRRTERHRPFTRPLRVTLGVALILGGVAIGWLPGPGFVILAFPGALLVASEWRRAALLLDRVEEETLPRLRRLHARLRGGPKEAWVAEEPELWEQWSDRRGSGAEDTGERRRRGDAVGDELEDDDARHA